MPSLTGFLVWMQTDDVEVKRQLDGEGPFIRVMTVHGAKGLEGEIVILPDTGDRKPQERDQLYRLPDGPAVTKAEKLKHVQGYLEAGHEGAVQIWQSIGVYLGYSLAHYAEFYDLKHVLILGRVTSGSGGQLILDGAHAVLAAEFPELAGRVHIQLPDEKSRRVGQSIAAASLPALR